MPSAIAVLVTALIGPAALGPVWGVSADSVPSTAQIIDQKVFNVLDFVPPPAEANDSTVRPVPSILCVMLC
jgi:gluconolactonase